MKIDIFNANKKYDIIYADPPWTFKTYSEKGKEKKSAECHYKRLYFVSLGYIPLLRGRLGIDKEMGVCLQNLWI